MLTDMKWGLGRGDDDGDGREGKMKAFVVTSDRDEHVRISEYPETFRIRGFCLGHRKWVLCYYY